MNTLAKSLAAAACCILMAAPASAEDVIAVRISPVIDGQIALITLVAARGSDRDCEHVKGAGLKARMSAVHVPSGKPAGSVRSACWYIDEDRDQIVVHSAADSGSTMVFKYPTREFTNNVKASATR